MAGLVGSLAAGGSFASIDFAAVEEASPVIAQLVLWLARRGHASCPVPLREVLSRLLFLADEPFRHEYPDGTAPAQGSVFLRLSWCSSSV